MYFSRARQTQILDHLFQLIRDETTTMVDEVFEFDPSIYADDNIAVAEREKIFGRLPVMAAHSSQLPEPGSYVVLDMNSSSVILTRQSDGNVGAFLNQCRHRGAKVIPENINSGRNRKSFTCPYHGWVYNNQGQNRSISYDDTFGKTASADLGLAALPVEERHGFVWVVENPGGHIDVSSYLGTMDEVLAAYGLDKWHFYKDHVFEFPQNWKIMVDGLADSYHVEFLHGATISDYFLNNINYFEVRGDHTINVMPRRTLLENIDRDPAELDVENQLIIGNRIGPNSEVVMHPHHIEYWTIYQDPKNTAKCRVHLRYLTPEAEHDENGVRILDKNWEIATSAIINEDVPIGNDVQANANNRFGLKAIIGKNEVHNQVFHRSYQRYMQE